MSEARDFPTAVIASISSGVLLCNFSEMHEAAEYLMGHQIWTHHFANKELWQEMDLAWLGVKDLLVSGKHAVRQAGDNELSKEISKLLSRAQSAFRIARQQSYKQGGHQQVLEYLQGFQNQVSALQAKLYGTV